MDLVRLLIYEFALAFQIAGAVLLLLKYWGNTKQRIINVYYPGAGIASNDDNDNAVLDVSRVRECAMEIYSSRMAFIYIVIGYALSIFGEKGVASSVIVLVVVSVASGVLIGIEFIMARSVAIIRYKDDIIIPHADLPRHVPKEMSDKDIDRMFK